MAVELNIIGHTVHYFAIIIYSRADKIGKAYNHAARFYTWSIMHNAVSTGLGVHWPTTRQRKTDRHNLLGHEQSI